MALKQTPRGLQDPYMYYKGHTEPLNHQKHVRISFPVHETLYWEANFKLLVAYRYQKQEKMGIFAVFPDFREGLFSLAFSFLTSSLMKIMQKFKKYIDPDMFHDHLHHF